jgi:hypothetical protein
MMCRMSEHTHEKCTVLNIRLCRCRNSFSMGRMNRFGGPSTKGAGSRSLMAASKAPSVAYEHSGGQFAKGLAPANLVNLQWPQPHEIASSKPTCQLS